MVAVDRSAAQVNDLRRLSAFDFAERPQDRALVRPPSLPRIAGLAITASYEPSGRAGGDLYDFFPLEPHPEAGGDRHPTSTTFRPHGVCSSATPPVMGWPPP
jgi:hypothetical protein